MGYPQHQEKQHQQQSSSVFEGTAIGQGGTSGAGDANEVEWLVDLELRRAIVQMIEDEQASPIDANYMTHHGREVMAEGLWITPAMRFMTINWMSEAMHDLQVNQHVVMMAVTLLDRYLSHARYFPRTMLQLAAAACIFVATKIEGKLPHPRGSDIAALADGAFDLSHLVTFERTLCQTLQFNLYGPTTHNFLDMWVRALPASEDDWARYFAAKAYVLASYLLELSALVYDMLNRSRSVTAAAALLIAYADPGLHAAVAARLHRPTTEVAAQGMRVIASARTALGPGVDGEQLILAAAEVLRLLRLSQQPQRRELFVNVKFGHPDYDHIAEIAQPMETDEFKRVVRLFFEG